MIFCRKKELFFSFSSISLDLIVVLVVDIVRKIRKQLASLDLCLGRFAAGRLNTRLLAFECCEKSCEKWLFWRQQLIFSVETWVLAPKTGFHRKKLFFFISKITLFSQSVIILPLHILVHQKPLIMHFLKFLVIGGLLIVSIRVRHATTGSGLKRVVVILLVLLVLKRIWKVAGRDAPWDAAGWDDLLVWNISLKILCDLWILCDMRILRVFDRWTDWIMGILRRAV